MPTPLLYKILNSFIFELTSCDASWVWVSFIEISSFMVLAFNICFPPCWMSHYTLFSLRLLIEINSVPSIPATSKPTFSYMPKFKAAPKPIIDQMAGMINNRMGTLRIDVKRMPKVNMVVGHGRPKVGSSG